MSELSIRWCADPTAVPGLVDFFVEHTDASYISHGELMDGRAVDLDTWSPALKAVLSAELSQAEFSATPGQPTGKRVVIAGRQGVLAGFALVELGGAEQNRHAVLHDLVVDSAQRGSGAGRQILEWLERELAGEGVRYLLLESGKGNEAAHRFFERAGFEVSSVTMVKTLG